jgi:hypothetical protein
VAGALSRPSSRPTTRRDAAFVDHCWRQLLELRIDPGRGEVCPFPRLAYAPRPEYLAESRPTREQARSVGRAHAPGRRRASYVHAGELNARLRAAQEQVTAHIMARVGDSP